MRAAEQVPALGRLRGRLGSLLADVRAARGDRRGRELHLPAAAARDGREDDLLGDELPPARRDADEPARARGGQRLGRPDLLPRSRVLGLRDALDRAQRDVWLEPPDAVVAHERAVPAERHHLRQAPARARRASVPAPVHEALHRRRGSRLVARGFALHGLRARDLFQLASAPLAGGDSRITNAPKRVPPGRHRSHRDRDPAVEDRDLPRLPHEPRGGRPGRAEAGERLVQHHQAAGARGQAGEPGDPVRDRSGPGAGASGRLPIATPTSRRRRASTSGRATRPSATARRWRGLASTPGSPSDS